MTRKQTNAAVVAALLVAVGVYVYAFMPRARAWPRGAWDAADINRDGVLTRAEMLEFGGLEAHRNGPRLMWHFDRADTNADGIVDAAEVEVYGTKVGSQDPDDKLPPPTAEVSPATTTTPPASPATSATAD